jgi:hypothetical protein
MPPRVTLETVVCRADLTQGDSEGGGRVHHACVGRLLSPVTFLQMVPLPLSVFAYDMGTMLHTACTQNLEVFSTGPSI